MPLLPVDFGVRTKSRQRHHLLFTKNYRRGGRSNVVSAQTAVYSHDLASGLVATVGVSCWIPLALAVEVLFNYHIFDLYHWVV